MHCLSLVMNRQPQRFLLPPSFHLDNLMRKNKYTTSTGWKILFSVPSDMSVRSVRGSNLITRRGLTLFMIYLFIQFSWLTSNHELEYVITSNQELGDVITSNQALGYVISVHSQVSLKASTATCSFYCDWHKKLFPRNGFWIYSKSVSHQVNPPKWDRPLLTIAVKHRERITPCYWICYVYGFHPSQDLWRNISHPQMNLILVVWLWQLGDHHFFVRAIVSLQLNFGLSPWCPQVVWCHWREIELFAATLAQDGLAECDKSGKLSWNSRSQPGIEPGPQRGQTTRYNHSSNNHDPGREEDSEIFSFSHWAIMTRATERTDGEIHSFSHWAIMTRATGRIVRFFHSPTELSCPGPRRGQTVRYSHSPTDLSWPGSWRGQRVRYFHSATETFKLTNILGLGSDTGCPLHEVHPLGILVSHVLLGISIVN